VLRLGQTWKVVTWGNCTVGKKYPWKVAAFEKAIGTVHLKNCIFNSLLLFH